jgi:hypothetical protein
MAATLDPPRLEVSGGGKIVEFESASITPPQSANGKKDAPEGVPSELSDLELDFKSAAGPGEPSIKREHSEEPEVLEDIEPDHYYGGGKIPVFKPVSIPNLQTSLQLSWLNHSDKSSSQEEMLQLG